MRIIFMGTPKFAVPFLEKIAFSDHKVVAVFTQDPKMQGRGMDLVKSYIHVAAEKLRMPVYTPKTLKSDDIFDIIMKIEADLIVVVAYGFIVPKRILESKKYGCINVHPSLLPKYRGAAPMQHVILNGDKETGVCIMQMDEGMDTGDIIMHAKFDIDHKITLEELSRKSEILGSQLLLEVIDNIDILPRIKQQGIPTIANKIKKEHGKIDWKESAFSIDSKIRAFNPWIAVFFEYKGEKIKVIKAVCIENLHTDHKTGEVINDSLTIACGEGALQILELQKPGKRVMTAKEFLNGNRIKKGVILE